mmetsp:Transcript_19372/g.57354  ORF Transcript_19372/g.57354 Transcript_19372/m.57354 type:complete len:193 (+) Transcript_19372:158-736(+)
MSRILSFAMLWGTARALTTTTRRQFAVAGGAGLASSLAAAPPARAGTPLGEGTTASGLRYIVQSEGAGPKPQRGQVVKLDYVLRAGVDGKPPVYVEGTKETPTPKPAAFTIGVGAQIPGFDEAVSDMSVGEKRTVIIPPQLAYGSKGTMAYDQKIPEDATLIYTFELRSVLPFAPTKEQSDWIAANPNPWER